MATANIDELHRGLMDLVGALTRPQLDEKILGEGKVSLDRALFPLLVRISLYGPINIAELADMVGRDQSTVSRQTGKLESLALIERRPSERDQRVREMVTTITGRKMVKAIGDARQKVFAGLMADWTMKDQSELARLVRKLADEMARQKL